MPTTTPFANLITFSRGSNATVVGPNGLVQWAPHNLLTFSEQFDNAAWTKTASTVTANTAVAPDGTTTADTLAETAATSGHVVSGSATVTTATHVFSVYLKKGPGATAPNWVQLYTGGVSAQYANFNLGTGTVGSVAAGSTATITNVGNGWYRCTLSFTPSSSGSLTTAIAFTNNTDTTTRGPSYAGATTSDVFIWGAQAELGSAATTYNPTTVKNLLGFSEAFDNAAWTKTGASIVTGAQANPINGLFNAQKLMENTANAQHRVTNSVTLAAAPHTLSAYLKAGERTWALMVNGTIANGFAYFNLSTGVVGSVGAGVTAASIAAVGSGWYRCAITFTAPAGSNGFEIRTASADGISIYTGDGNSGVYIYGAQLSDSASLDPYVPTPGAAPSSTAYYGPRFDYDPVTRAARGILIEEQRTNLCTRSEEFDNAAWTKVTANVAANATTSPDGTVDADSLTATGGNAQHYVNQSFSYTSGTAYTLSVFAKKNTLNGVQLTFGSGAFSTLPYANFDLNSGTSFTSNCTATLTDFGNGWYRCTMTATATSTTSSTGVIGLARDTAESRLPTFDSDGNGIFIYGAQLEAGAFATSYIPTIASTVTRNADVALITGQNFAQWYTQSEGAWAVEWAAANGNFVIVQVSAATNSDRFLMLSSSADQVSVTTASVGQGVIDAGTINAGAANKLSYAYRTNDTAASLNGGAAAADITVALPTVDRLCLGATAVAAALLNGHIRSIRYIPVRAADFQLQALTT